MTDVDDHYKLAAAVAPGIAAAVRRFDDDLAYRIDLARARLDVADDHTPAVVATLARVVDVANRPRPAAYVALNHELPGLGLLTDDEFRRAISPLLTPTPAGPRCCAESLRRGESMRGVVRGWGHDWYCLLPDGHIGGTIGGRHGFDDATHLAELADTVGLTLFEDDGALEWIDSALGNPDAHNDPDAWRAACEAVGIAGDLLLPWARRLTKPGDTDPDLAAWDRFATGIPRSR